MKTVGKFFVLLVVASLALCDVIIFENSRSSKKSDYVNLEDGFEITGTLNEVKSAWTSFKKDFSKVFSNFKNEREHFLKFAETFLLIKRHNIQYAAGEKSFEMGLNIFSDMTEEEMRVYRGYRQSHARPIGSTFLSSAVPVTLPDLVDWRDKGAVTPVKNQGACGSCWAFSTTGTLEGQHFLKKRTLVSLSEQQLVDCSKSPNAGCNGGIVDSALKYIKENKGITTEAKYPYVSGTKGSGGDCKYKNGTAAATVTGYVDIQKGSESQLKEAVASKGPISVAIDASHPSFQSYKSGVYDEPQCSSSDLDHAVLLVGYGTEKGRDYWLVKNSWGPGWGEQGYIKMRRNQNNQCGIATQASYPLV